MGYEWLASREGRLDDVLLLIRHREYSQNIGSIGWSDYNAETRSAEFGRLAIDPSVLRTLAKRGEVYSNLRGLAFDAAIAIRDYAFEKLAFLQIRTCHKRGNTLSAQVTKAIGMIVTPTQIQNVEDEFVYQALSRQQWQSLRQKTE